MDTKNATSKVETTEIWPSLPFEEWQDTYETLHMWMQIVGKVIPLNISNEGVMNEGPYTCSSCPHYFIKIHNCTPSIHVR